MDNPEKSEGAIKNGQSSETVNKCETTEGAIKNGQSRETVNKRETTEGAIKNGQSRETVNKRETTEGAIKNGQSRETGNIRCTMKYHLHYYYDYCPYSLTICVFAGEEIQIYRFLLDPFQDSNLRYNALYVSTVTITPPKSNQRNLCLNNNYIIQQL
jgi:hypothetical protein